MSPSLASLIAVSASDGPQQLICGPSDGLQQLAADSATTASAAAAYRSRTCFRMSWSELVIANLSHRRSSMSSHRGTGIDGCQYAGHDESMTRSATLPLADIACCAPL